MVNGNGDAIDPKVVDRIRKILNLARDGGATEAEASLAMERAEAIALDNNLSMAMVEASGGAVAEKRLKDAFSGRASFRWQRYLMEEIAKARFCYVIVIEKQSPIRYGATRRLQTGYELIGRESNVTIAKTQFEYLNETIARLRKEYGGSAKDGALFSEGVAGRLRERIAEGHRVSMREQKERAEASRRERETRSKHPSAAPDTGNALVIVLEDYATEEAEKNNDLRHGWPQGTTRTKREEGERKERERNERYNALLKEGVNSNVAFLIAHLGWTKERAEAYQAAQEANKDKRDGRSYRYRKTREERMRDREYENTFSRQYQDGARAGDSVGLDEQVGSSPTKKIGG